MTKDIKPTPSSGTCTPAPSSSTKSSNATVRTADALRALEKHMGQPWRQVIRSLAEDGYTWADVAEIVGVKKRTLVWFCHTRNLKFPWMGNSSPIKIAAQKRALTGRKRGTYKCDRRFTAFGITHSLSELHRRFGKASYQTTRRRLSEGWTLEDALATPAMDRQTAARTSYKRVACNQNHLWRQDERASIANFNARL